MRIGIIGMGYVGLPLAVEFAEQGHDVTCVDVDAAKIAALERGDSYVEDIGDERLEQSRDRLAPTTRYAELANADAVLIAVPTPLTANREPDLGPLEASGAALAEVLQRGQLVVLESTTYPGTTRDRLKPLLERSGLEAGADFHLAFSPERVDPGRTDFTMRNTPKLVAGLTEHCGRRARELYEEVCDEVVPLSSLETAELAKLLENVYRSVNIALVNELAMLCHRIGLDVWEVVDAAATKPYGFQRFAPGPGMGGHCLPVDPFYLAWKAREYDMPTQFIELAGEVNQRMPYFCVDRVAEALNEQAKPVRGARIAIVGVSYKPGVADLRESPALRIMRLLGERGADVSYHDDFVPELPDLDLRSEWPDDADCVVIVTAHPGLDVQRLVDEAPLVVDFRGATRGVEAGHLVRL